MSQQRAGLIVASVLVCLIVGAGIERVRQAVMMPVASPESPAEEHDRFTPTVRTVVVTNSAAERAVSEALRLRVAELEKALAAREAAAPLQETKPSEKAPEERPARQSFTERLEQMKKDNPEQYAEEVKRREEFRQNMEQRAQDRAEFIAAVDTRNMNDEQRENHTKLLATVARANELMAQMGQPGVERTPEMRQEMGEVMSSLGDLYSTERRYLLEETARTVGYDGSQVSEFADQMQAIVDNTTMPRRGGRGGPPAAIPTGQPTAGVKK